MSTEGDRITQIEAVQELANDAYGWFETAYRRMAGDEVSYVRTREGAPEWVRDLCLEAHGEMLPDDWRYVRIRSALACLLETNDPEDAAHEWADAECDIYTGQLGAWLMSNALRFNYVDNAVCDHEYDFGGRMGEGITGALQLGQYDEAREIYDAVWRFLQDLAETDTDAEEEA